jgi:hypothetical protein
MLWLGWPRQGRYIALPRLRRRRGAERTLVHRPLRRPRRLLGLRRGGRRWREAPVGGSDNRAEPPHRRHVDSAGAHGGGPGVRWEVGVSRAGARIRVSGEEEGGAWSGGGAGGGGGRDPAGRRSGASPPAPSPRQPAHMSHAIPLRFRCSARGGGARPDGGILTTILWRSRALRKKKTLKPARIRRRRLRGWWVSGAAAAGEGGGGMGWR